MEQNALIDNLFGALTEPSALEGPAFLLWQVIAKKHDIMSLIAICEAGGPGEEAEWKQSVYNLFQEALMDETILASIEIFEECEKMIDKGMTMLNLGIAMGPKLVYMFRLVLAFALRTIQSRGWEQYMTSFDAPPQEVDKVLVTITASFSGLITLDTTRWITPGPLPVKFEHKGIIPQDMVGRVDFQVVRDLVKYLEEQGLITFE